MRTILFLLCCSILLGGCKAKREGNSAMSAAFAKAPQNSNGQYDLADLRRSGEIIVVTLSGPETYYDYHGLPMGCNTLLLRTLLLQKG